MRSAWVLIAIAVVLVGCGKTQPQRPRVMGEEQIDTTLTQMLAMNQHMASDADLQLVNYASESYVMQEDGCWVQGLGEVGTDTLADNEYISLEARIFDLKGRLLTTHQAETQVGKVDEIPAITNRIKAMHRNQSVSMLVPWYMAFGSAGNQEVLPYENVRIELMIK